MSQITGRTVALTSCPAHDEQGASNAPDVQISGLYDVEEYFSVEPSAYVWSPYYLVVPHDVPHDVDGPWFSVDADVLEAQVDPAGYGRQLAEERQMELAQEDEWRREQAAMA